MNAGREESELQLLTPKTPDTQARQRTNDITTGLFDHRTRYERAAPLIAIFLQLLVVIFLCIIIPCDIWLSPEGALSTTLRTVYSTGVTIIASLIAAFTAAQVRSLWLRNIFQSQPGPGVLREDRVKRARVLLRIGAIRDTFRFFILSTSLLIIGLVTAAIVGSTTLSIVGHRINSYTALYTAPDPTEEGCFSVKSVLNSSDLGWQLSDGSYLTLNHTGTSEVCPSVISNDLVQNGFNAYGFDGIFVPNCFWSAYGGVGCAALGTPFTLDTYCGISSSFTICDGVETRNDVLLGTACAPTLVSNPLQCRILNQTNGENGCTTAGNGTSRGLTVQHGPDSSVGICTSGRAFGDASITLFTKNASDISNLVKILEGNSSASADVSDYTIECDITLAPAFGFRSVQYDPNGQNDGYGEFSPMINGTGTYCDPTVSQTLTEGGAVPITNISQTLTDIGLSTAIGILFSLFEQSTLGDTLDLLYRLSQGYAGEEELGRLAFANSKNLLEDRLGIILGLGMGLYWGTVTEAEGQVFVHPYIFPVELTVPGERVGSGSRAAIVYILPSLFAIFLIMSLYLRGNRLAADQA